MNTLGKLLLVLAATLSACRSSAQGTSGAASWFDQLTFSASAAATSVENISRTSHIPTRKDATTYELTVSAGGSQQVAPSWMLSGGIDATFLNEPKFDLNNRSAFNARLGLQHKFGLGPLAPVLQFDASYGYKSARLSADRGGIAEAGLRLGKRLTPYLKVGASTQWREHFAQSATFDTQERSLGIDATWDISDHWRLSGTASRLDGRLVTNASPVVWAQAIGGALGPRIASYYNSIPSEVTHLYGPGWLSYLPEVKADFWTLALAYVFSERTLIEARLGSAYVINEVDVRYPSKSWGLGVVHRF